MFGRNCATTLDGGGNRWTRRQPRAQRALLGTVIAVTAAASTMVLPAGASDHGVITTIAGNGQFGGAGDGGPATAAQLFFPGSVTVDRAGNTVLIDTFNNRVRAVAASTGTFYGIAMTAGDIYTVAGAGPFATGGVGDGGPATAAKLAFPEDLKVDRDGNLVLAETFGGRVRVVAASTGTFYGIAMTANDIYTVAGGNGFGASGDGGPATAAQLSRPSAVALDKKGNLAIADAGSNTVRMVAAATGTFYGVAMTAGDIYTIAGAGGAGYAGDGGPASSATFNFPDGLVFDGPGNLVIVDSSNNALRVLANHSANFYGVSMTAGDVYTVAGGGPSAGGFAGDGGAATAAKLNLPNGVTVDGAGDLLVGDSLNNRVRAVAAANGNRYGVLMQAGDIYTVAGSSVGGFAGDGGPATSASLNFPEGVAVDGAGDILIADAANSRVRMVTG